MSAVSMRSRVLGSLLGGAVGDAIGTPIRYVHGRGVREENLRVLPYR